MEYKAYNPKLIESMAHRRRDAARIPRILEKLGKLWMRYPDLRLGQLLNNARGLECTDLFWLEDDVLEQRIEEGFGNDPKKP
jgi:hypothetical protein